eukprot:11185600-Lingulodinium_polyedra.AAC.1
MAPRGAGGGDPRGRLQRRRGGGDHSQLEPAALQQAARGARPRGALDRGGIRDRDGRGLLGGDARQHARRRGPPGLRRRGPWPCRGAAAGAAACHAGSRTARRDPLLGRGVELRGFARGAGGPGGGGALRRPGRHGALPAVARALERGAAVAGGSRGSRGRSPGGRGPAGAGGPGARAANAPRRGPRDADHDGRDSRAAPLAGRRCGHRAARSPRPPRSAAQRLGLQRSATGRRRPRSRRRRGHGHGRRSTGLGEARWARTGPGRSPCPEGLAARPAPGGAYGVHAWGAEQRRPGDGTAGPDRGTHEAADAGRGRPGGQPGEQLRGE